MNVERVTPNGAASESEEAVIFTDGARIGNPGKGGYAAVVLDGNRRSELVQGFRQTTNNRMEIMAAIAGLESLDRRRCVKVYTDSKYLEESVSRGWAKKWRAKGWVKGKGTRINFDLWDRLLKVCEQHDVSFFWVAGHSGNVENERCDWLAMQVAYGSNLLVDIAYEQATRGFDRRRDLPAVNIVQEDAYLAMPLTLGPQQPSYSRM